MTMKNRLTRRRFVQAAGAAASLSIVPRNVLGGEGIVPPSETLGAALIGCGGRSGGTYNDMTKRLQAVGIEVKLLARCDVKFADRADNKEIYTDYRRVLERRDVDFVAIATHPGWHALISIAAMEAGKDVMCEKPMTRFIAEGRAVVEAEKRFNRVFQLCTFGRFGAARDPGRRQIHKMMASGLLKKCPVVHIKKGGLKVREWSGRVVYQPAKVPPSLDWDMYCGPAPLRPYQPHRVGGTHRGYWDYEGGGLADMGQHHFDPVQWTYAKDHTSPVEIESYAPPAHPEACGMWGWVELKYEDGCTFVFESAEWGEPYDRAKPRELSIDDFDEEAKRKLAEMPDPEPLLEFGEAVKQRKKSGGHAEAAHRSATLLHLANIAIRMGRKIRYDPVKEEIVGDEEANRLVRQPMRAPWRI